MPIPKHNEIRVPVLEFLLKNGANAAKDIFTPLCKHFNLTEEEIRQLYPSGKGHVFKNRVGWALSYLVMAKLIHRLRRGVYEITGKGKELLASPELVDDYVDKQQKLKEEAKQKAREEWHDLASLSTFVPISEMEEIESYTPEEKLFQSYENIRKSTLEEILDMLVSKSPREFEKLVVLLLQKMGYGGEIKDSGIVTQASNDHGIDGIIKKDILGLERIYIQAKCYDLENGIGREHIQKFVGAIAGMQSKNGIFITTSYYHKTALDYVKNLNGNPNLILINGEELANYIYDYNLGMQTEQIITIKKLDSDFWDEMEDK